MNAEQVRQRSRASPFRPFRLHTASGKKIDVAHPELVSFSPTGRFMDIWKRDESWENVDVLLVTSMETIKRNGASRHRRKR